MSDLDNEKRSLNDLSGVSLSVIKVTKHTKRKPRTKEHNEAISKAKKNFYASDKGMKEKKARSERTKLFWASEAGQAKRERIRAKYKSKTDSD